MHKCIVCVYLDWLFLLKFFDTYIYIFPELFTHQFQQAQVPIHFHKLFEHQLPPFFLALLFSIYIYIHAAISSSAHHCVYPQHSILYIMILAWWKPKIRIESNLFCFGFGFDIYFNNLNLKYNFIKLLYLDDVILKTFVQTFMRIINFECSKAHTHHNFYQN